MNKENDLDSESFVEIYKMTDKISKEVFEVKYFNDNATPQDI